MQSRIPGPVPPDLTLFETMRREADGRIALWPLHLDRLQAGCLALGFPLDGGLARDMVADMPVGTALRVRLAVDASGTLSITQAPLPPAADVWRVVISDHRLRAGDPWLGVKSSYRPVYDAARAALPVGLDEALLLNQHGQISEGTITNVFLRDGARLLTPPLSCGLLPGVLRRHLLETGRATEAVLTPDMLAARDLFCGNALRGLIPARLVAINSEDRA